MLKSNNKIIARKVRVAKTTWSRLKGLMFENPKRFNYALVMELPREGRAVSAIHMFFVFFPIDVLFLDKEKKVVEKATLNPFTPNYTPKKPAKYVIELPEGKGKGIKMGSRLSW